MHWMVFNWQNLVEVVIILMVSGIKKSLNNKLTIFVNMFQSHERESSFMGRGEFCSSQIFENRARGRESEQWRKLPSAKSPIRAA